MSKHELTKRDIVRFAIFINKNASVKDMARFIEEYDLSGVKVKSDDEKYLHLVVNKVTDKKDVERMLKKYIDHLLDMHEFPIDLHKGHSDLKLSAFDILIAGKNWYIEIFEIKGC